MTPNEFKAWFDGFTEAFDGCIPSKAQWGRIKDRVAEIDGKPITHTVYLDRYLPSYPSYPYYGRLQPYWSGLGHTTTYTSNATSGLSQNASQQYAQAAQSNNINNQVGSGGLSFNSLQAMADLGRVEAAEVA